MDPREKSKPDSAPENPSAAGPNKPSSKSGTPRSPEPADPGDSIPAGRIRHDDRGNAVWDWRSGVDSTSSLLKKLEIPHLEVEDRATEGKKEDAPRPQPNRDPGGGYDPYNQTTRPRRLPPRKG